MTLDAIAAQIAAHLKRFEADPVLSKTAEGKAKFWMSNSWAAGRFVYVKYISYQLQWHLSKEEAERYLAALDAGMVGKHTDYLKYPKRTE